MTYFVFPNCVYFIDILTPIDGINCFFYCLKSLIVFRIIKLQDIIISIQDDIHRQLSRLGLILLAVLLLGTSYLLSFLILLIFIFIFNFFLSTFFSSSFFVINHFFFILFLRYSHSSIFRNGIRWVFISISFVVLLYSDCNFFRWFKSNFPTYSSWEIN